MANPAVVVDFVANTSDLQKGFRQAQGSTSGFTSKLKGLAKTGALAAGAAGVAGLTAAVKIGIDEFSQAQKVTAQTNAVLKSTGKVAGVTSQGVQDLAGSLMKKSGVDDEAIQSGENLLLTFTNIRNEAGKGNDVFDQTTKAALDMSVALGTDMKSASMQLGKALNDPIKGVTKLTRSGVTFTDAQKKSIESLVKHGKTLEAQKIILGEVNKEFGGSAVAAGKTLPGQINILKESFNNLAGAMIAKLIPVIQSTIQWLRDHWPEISAAFSSMWNTVKPILDGLWQLLKTVADIVIAAWPLILPVVQLVGNQIKAVAKIIALALKLVVDLIRGNWKAAWNDFKTIVTTALNAVKSYMLGVPAVLAKIALSIGRAILGGVKDGMAGLASWVKDRIGDARDAIKNAVSSAYNAAVSLGKKILSGVKDGMEGLYSWVRDRVSGVVDAVSAFIDNAYSRAKSIGNSIYNGVVDGISGLVGKVRGMVSEVINAVKGALRGFKIGPVKIKGHTIIPEVHPFASLATGGIVTRPTMALIGEAGPEAVIPLSGAGSGAVHVRVFIGDTELRGLVRNEIVDQNTGIARALLAGGAG